VKLVADVGVTCGGFALRAALEAAAGEVVAVAGPNGAGKSTLLRALAGLVPLDAGEVRLGERVLDAPAAGVFVPPAARSVGLVFQDHRLFPHLSVLDNVAFGVRAHGAPIDTARSRAAEWLERAGASHLAAQRPAALSGGEAQRVALARALATEPALLLLDEPLAAIDAASKRALRALVAATLRERAGPSVLVTHDPVEAAVLGARALVLEAGRVVECGEPSAIAAAPRSDYGAEHVGLNVFRGRAEGHALVLAGGARLVLAGAYEGMLAAVVHPRAVSLYPARPDGSPRNAWPATVAAATPLGECVRARLDGAIPIVAEVTARAAADLALAPGRPLWVSLKATEIQVVPG